MIRLDVRSARYDLAEVFTISRGSKSVAETVIVELHDGAHVGRGGVHTLPALWRER